MCAEGGKRKKFFTLANHKKSLVAEIVDASGGKVANRPGVHGSFFVCDGVAGIVRSFATRSQARSQNQKLSAAYLHGFVSGVNTQTQGL
jgi:hypothetical protein